jgi:uncharacterized protein YndB with AHSA1/START domain
MNNRTNSARNDYGEVRTENGQKVLRFEREVAHPPEKVWRALIEPGELVGWFPCRIEGERKLGATLHFIFDNGKAPTYSGTITEFDPPRLLAYLWETELLRWELQPTAKGSLLIFTISLEFDPADSAAGWHTCFDLLEKQLAGEALPWTVDARNEQMLKEYTGRFA